MTRMASWFLWKIRYKAQNQPRLTVLKKAYKVLGKEREVLGKGREVPGKRKEVLGKESDLSAPRKQRES